MKTMTTIQSNVLLRHAVKINNLYPGQNDTDTVKFLVTVNKTAYDVGAISSKNANKDKIITHKYATVQARDFWSKAKKNPSKLINHLDLQKDLIAFMKEYPAIDNAIKIGKY